MAILDEIKHLSFFSSLSLVQLQRLLPIIKKHELAAQKTLLFEGDSNRSIYVIGSGEIEIYKYADSNHSEGIYLTTLKTGEIFGEISFITGDSRSATLVTATSVIIYEINKQDFDELSYHHPAPTYSIMLKINQVLCKRIRNSSDEFTEIMASLQKATKK